MRYVLFSAFCCAAVFIGNGALAQDQGFGHLTSAGKLIAGPHLSGDEYVNLRWQEEHKTLQFDLSSDVSPSGNARITLGPDYVIEVGRDGTVFYDFRFRRKLAWTPSDIAMSSGSQFADWHFKWALLENNLGTSAIVQRLKTTAGGETDNPSMRRFYIERNIGLSYPSAIAYEAFPTPEINEVRTKGEVGFEIDGVRVGGVVDGKLNIPSAEHSRTFAAWLAWSGRAHPKIAKLIAERQILPKTYIRAGDPDNFALNEVIRTGETLEFSNPSEQQKSLDVMQGLSAAPPSWDVRYPEALGAQMIAAIRGEANGGPTTDEQYLAIVKRAIEEGRALDAALLAISPKLACDTDANDRDICGFAFEQLRTVINDPEVKVLLSGLQADQEGRHAEATQLLLPLLDRDLKERSVLEIIIANTLVEAKNNGQLEAPDLIELYGELPMIFERAFTADPYTVMWYRDFYNYLYSSVSSVDEGYIVPLKAYSVIDIARALPERPVPPLVSAISDVERTIAQDFPTYFPGY